MGVFVPSMQSPYASWWCYKLMTNMVKNCGTKSKFDAASYNVRALPNAVDNGQGVDPREIRYVMASQKLTF